MLVASPGTPLDLSRERPTDRKWFVLTLLFLVVEYGRPMDFIPVLGSMHFAMVITLLLVASWLLQGSLKLARSPQTTVLLLFIALLAVHVPFARNNYLALLQTKGIAMYLPFFLSAVIYFNSLARIRAFFNLWIALMIYLALRGIMGKGVGGSSFLADENDFALLINMMVPFGLYLLLQEKTWAMKAFYLASSLLGIVSIVVSFSRGGFLGLVAVMGVIWLFSPRKLLAFTLVMILAGTVLLSASNTYWREMSTIKDTQEGTAQGRLDAWNAAWEMFKDNPCGVGGSNFPIRFHEYQPPTVGRLAWGTVVHSLWLTLLSELGVFGVLLYGLLLYFNLRDLRWLFSMRLQNSESAQYAAAGSLACLACLAGYFASGTFLSVLYYPHYFYLSAVIVALRKVVEKEVERIELVAGP